MKYILFYLFFSLWLVSIPAIIVLLISFVVALIKRSNFKRIVLIVLACLVFVGVYFSYITPDYSKAKIDLLTKNRLVDINLEDINLDIFEWSESLGLYEYEVKTENSYIVVSYIECKYNAEEVQDAAINGNNEFVNKIFGQGFGNGVNYVFIKPRESDREFLGPIVPSSYNTLVRVVGKNYLLMFSVGGSKGQEQELLNQALDKILQ